MNDKLADKIAVYLLDEKLSLDYIKIKYYLESILGELEKFLILFVVFSLCGYMTEILLIMVVMLLIRPYVGGTHFSSYGMCLLYTALVCGIIVILGVCIEDNIYVYIGAYLLMLVVIVVCAPVKNEFRPHYVGALRTKIKLRATFSLMLVGVIHLIGWSWDGMHIAVILYVLSVDALVAWYRNKRVEDGV